MILNRFRKQLDLIDTRLVRLLAKRQSLARKIGVYKAKTGMEIFQPNREGVIKERLEILSRKYDLDSHFLSTIWNQVMSESIKVQEEEVEKYKKEHSEEK